MTIPMPDPEQELRTTAQRVAIAMQARITVRIEQIGVDVTSTFDCMPKREVCYNCATELPKGCGGIFQDDGEHCRWRKP